MTKKSVVARALLSSVLALILCVTMLIGTTYAWFTDSVTSANNVIKSGNLDIELEYWNGTEWADVQGKDTLFAKDALWEPGHTEVVYLKITNAGSLALKYQFGINVVGETAGTNVAGETFRLSDYIKFGVVEGVEADKYATRAEAVAAVTDAKAIKMGYTKASELLPTSASSGSAAEEYLALVVYMPETVGNEANYKTGTEAPYINLGVNVVATQYTYESDNFDNQYDAAAPWMGLIPETQPESLVLTLNAANKQGGTITIKSPEAFVYLNKLIADFEDKANSIPGFDHYYYNSEWKVELEADLDMSNIPMDTIALDYFGKGFDGKGHTISNVVLKDGQTALFNKGNVKNLTIKDAVVNAPDGQTVGVVVGTNASMNNVHVENATVVGKKYVGGIAGKGSSFVDCSIKNSTVTGSDKTVGGLVGYSIGDPGQATVSGNVVENVTVKGAYNVGGLLGQAQNEIVENNTVKNTTVISNIPLPAGASANEVRTGKIVARNVGATIGTNTEDNVTAVNAVLNTAELKAAIDGGATYVYAEGIELNEKLPLKSSVDAVFVDCTFTGDSTWGYAKNVTFENCTFDSGSDFAAIHFDRLYGDLVVENCTFKSGRVQIGNSDSATATFTNCEFAETASTSIWAEKGMRFYCPTTFNNCEFNNRVVLAGSNGLALNFNACTMNDGTPVYYVDNTDGIIRGGNVPTITIK